MDLTAALVQAYGQILIMFFFLPTNSTRPRLSQAVGEGDQNSFLGCLMLFLTCTLLLLYLYYYNYYYVFEYLTYESSNFIVVQIDQGTGIMSCFQSIHKELGNPLPKLHIVAAASPDPASATCKADKMVRTELPHWAEFCHRTCTAVGLG